MARPRGLLLLAALAVLSVGTSACSSSTPGWVAGKYEPLSSGGTIGLAAYLSWTKAGNHVDGTLVMPGIAGCQPYSTPFVGVISHGRVSLDLRGGNTLSGTITASTLVLSGLGAAPVVFSPGTLGDFDADSQKYCAGY
jgi:hypothetical protein